MNVRVLYLVAVVVAGWAVEYFDVLDGTGTQWDVYT
jgi:hypothetical protein